jgi:hypothetical protein
MTDADNSRIIYWHRDLPPMDAEPIGEHIVEIVQSRRPFPSTYS